MARLRLIHWNATKASARSAQLRRLGYTVVSQLPPMPDVLREVTTSPPAAIVTDLTRSPSQGRDLGILLRQRKATRFIPIVFAGGAPDKIARMRELLPDATFAEWEGIAPALRHAIPHPPALPVVHDSAFAAYAGRPLMQRLGIKPGMSVTLMTAPRDFQRSLASLPKGVRLTRSFGRPADLVLWFVRRPADLNLGLAAMVSMLGKGHVWIAWQKGGSAAQGNLTQQVIRAQALAAGLVDDKICSIDSTWSALLFRRRAIRPGRPRQARA